MLAGVTGLLTLFYPIFILFSKGDSNSLLIGQLCLAFLIALFVGPLAATTAESFSTSTRYTGVSAGINIGATLFGGTCPLIAAYLVQQTGNQMIPCFYPMFFALVCLFIIINMKTALIEQRQVPHFVTDRNLQGK
jgi:MHS family proline/betaine transporter-like MFS transporter